MPRLSPASNLPDRLLLGVGVLGLSATSLIYPASSHLYATPLSFVYAILLAVPAVAVLWQSATRSDWQLPSRPWTLSALALGLIILISAWLSPYQATVLRWSALPLSGIALFFWIHGWLQSEPDRRSETLLQAMALGTTAFTLVSLFSWTAKLLDRGFGPGLFAWIGAVRNPFPLGHSNYTAGVIVLGLPFIVRAAVRAQSTRRLAWIVAATLAIFTLLTSGSRGGLLALGLLTLIGVLQLRLTRRQLILVLAVGLIGAAALAFSHPRIRGFLQPADPSAPPNISSVQRLAMAQAGVLIGLDRPAVGWGLHSTPLVYPRFRAQLDGGAENVLQLHNTPLEIWAGLGFAGCLVGLCLLVISLRRWRHQPSAAIALLGYAAFALTDYQLDLPLIVAAIAALGAVLASPAPTVHRFTRQSRSLIAVGVIVATGLVLLIGREDPSPRLNVAALTLAQNPDFGDRAIPLLQESLTLNLDQEIAHFNLGWLQVVDAPVPAASHFRSALRLVPDKGGAYFGLGLSLLNQGKVDAAARAFALECLNDPSFARSPWWQIPAIAHHRRATRTAFEHLLEILTSQLHPDSWASTQLPLLRQQLPQLGHPQPGPERAFRRERTGYPVLVRNSNLPPPLDLFDLRESLSPSTDLPPKGWLPTPLLVSLLDETIPAPQ